VTHRENMKDKSFFYLETVSVGPARPWCQDKNQHFFRIENQLLHTIAELTQEASCCFSCFLLHTFYQSGILAFLKEPLEGAPQKLLLVSIVVKLWLFYRTLLSHFVIICQTQSARGSGSAVALKNCFCDFVRLKRATL